MRNTHPGVRSWLAALLLTAAGCDTTPFSPHEAQELRRAELQWKQAAIRNYDFEYRASCFCDPTVTAWTRIEVRNSRFAGATPLSTQVTQEEVDRYLWWPTIDSLFVSLHGGVSASDWLAGVTIEFDRQYGYPVRASFIARPNIADGGGGFDVRNFVRR
jgi:hypothetical protein